MPRTKEFGESTTPTFYGLHCHGIDPEVGAGPCNGGKLIYLTHTEYIHQLSQPNYMWRCPRCNANATWDDDNYERQLEEQV